MFSGRLLLYILRYLVQRKNTLFDDALQRLSLPEQLRKLLK